MVEEWRDVPDFEGWYEVSDLGRIRRVKWAKGVRAKRIRSSHPNRQGYYLVGLSRDSAQFTRTVHGLVARAFLEPPEGATEVNHLDGDKSNNCVENLEWVSRVQNARHAWASGLMRRGEERIRAKLTEDDVRYIRSSADSIKTLGRRFGVNPKTIWQARVGQTWSHVQ